MQIINFTLVVVFNDYDAFTVCIKFYCIDDDKSVPNRVVTEMEDQHSGKDDDNVNITGNRLLNFCTE